MAVWINIDKPNQENTIHCNPNCYYVTKWTNTKSLKKSVGHPLGPNGGWLKFNTRQDAEYYHKTHYSNYNKNNNNKPKIHC